IVVIDDNRTDEGVTAKRIQAPEGGQRIAVEAILVDLAFHDMDITPLSDHEIDFPPRLVAPIEESLSARHGSQEIEDKMFPQSPAVLVADVLPTADEADEPRVEPVRLRPANPLASPPSVKRRNGLHRPGTCPGL